MGHSLSYTEARQCLCGRMKPLGTEKLPLEVCFGRVLAEDFVSAVNIPPFDRSPYDGYALRAEDVQPASQEQPVTLTITEEIPAGGVPHVPVTAGTAAKILTGAPIPEGADCVVMFEKTQFTERSVTLFAPMQSGENVIYAGEDVKIGTTLASRGQCMDAGLLGTLAAQNKTAISVWRRPTVGILSTGSELRAPGEASAEGKIYDSNRYTFTGALADIGCIPVSCGIVPDTTDAIAAALEKALDECDAVVVTGGVSVGDYDLTPAAMQAVGAEILFQGCDIKPGMACAYGVRGGKLICALSGNPASSVTNFHLIARPALMKLCGRKDFIPEEIELTLSDGFGKKSPTTRLLRGRLDLTDGTVRMKIPADQGNVVLSSTIGCNVMAIVPAGSGKLAAGTRLKGFLL